MTYFINGWRESLGYFMSIGHFSEEEISYMIETGNTIRKNGNSFRIEDER